MCWLPLSIGSNSIQVSFVILEKINRHCEKFSGYDSDEEQGHFVMELFLEYERLFEQMLQEFLHHEEVNDKACKQKRLQYRRCRWRGLWIM